MSDQTIINIKRRYFNEKATIGELFIDKNIIRECFTLEDVVRPPGSPKVEHATAIPEGKYEIVIAYSNRFGRPMPRLLDVPGFEGILIHPGNSDFDTSGCILVGRQIVNNDFIGESRSAFGDLFPVIENFSKRGKVFVQIMNDPFVEPLIIKVA